MLIRQKLIKASFNNVKSTALAEENMSKYRNVDHHRFTSVARQKERLLQHDAFGTGIIGGRSSTKNVFFVVET